MSHLLKMIFSYLLIIICIRANNLNLRSLKLNKLNSDGSNGLTVATQLFQFSSDKLIEIKAKYS